MHIVHLINSLATGGAEQIVTQLCEEGIKQGHDVRVLTLNSKRGNPFILARRLGIPIESTGGELNLLSSKKQLMKFVRDADLVHSHLFPSLYIGAKFDGPKVFTEHNTTNRRRKNALFAVTDRWAYDSYDSLVGVSNGVSRNLGDYLDKIKARRNHVTTIHNGVHEKFFKVHRPRKKKYLRLLSVGSLTSQKNHELAIRVLTHLPEMTLDIAGSGPLKSNLIQEVKKLNLGERVNFLGDVRDMSSLFSKSDVLLSTSLFEGFGLAVLEAQASGMPVVVPRVEGLSEVVNDGYSARVFENSDPRLIAQMVLDVARPSQYENLSEGARAGASKFGMSECWDRHINLYSGLMK